MARTDERTGESLSQGDVPDSGLGHVSLFWMKLDAARAVREGTMG